MIRKQPLSETVSEKRRGRPRKHDGLYSILMGASAGEKVALASSSTAGFGGNVENYKPSRNHANHHYAFIAQQYLSKLDESLAWVWKSQAVKTELGRVIEAFGVNAATDLVHQIATRYPNHKVNAHEIAEGIRAGRMARKGKQP